MTTRNTPQEDDDSAMSTLLTQNQVRRLFGIGRQQVEGLIPTALETAILQLALVAWSSNMPIYGYDVKRQLEDTGFREPGASAAGIYRALGRCTDNKWLRRELQDSPEGPPRVIYWAEPLKTAEAYVIGRNEAFRAATLHGVGRGRSARRATPRMA